MTIADPSSVARENARESSGQFGTQEHTAPEAELAEERLDSQFLDDLSYVYGRDALRASQRHTDLRISAFVEDARETNPGATGAVFDWNYDDGATRLTFSHYTMADGGRLDHDDYPDINDFTFEQSRDARESGFVESDTIDGATLTFADFPTPDMAKAQAELSVSNKIRGFAGERDLRSLLVAAMDGADGASADRVANLTGYDLEQVQAILASAVRSTANYLRNS